MNTGWRATREARRPHTKNKLQTKHPKNRVSKARRKSVQESIRAMRRRGSSHESAPESMNPA